MGAPSIPLPLVNVGGAIRKPFSLPEGYVESPLAPNGFRCAQIKVSTDPDGVTRKAFRYVVRLEAVVNLERQFQELAAEIQASALEVETKRLRLVFQLRKRKQGFR
jgi:hypothetical protein